MLCCVGRVFHMVWHVFLFVFSCSEWFCALFEVVFRVSKRHGALCGTRENIKNKTKQSNPIDNVNVPIQYQRRKLIYIKDNSTNETNLLYQQYLREKAINNINARKLINTTISTTKKSIPQYERKTNYQYNNINANKLCNNNQYHNIDS